MSEAKTCPTCGGTIAADAPGGACPKCLFEAGFATGGTQAAPAESRVPTPEELAPKFPGLVIHELVGRGGMGVVYRARHKALDREVALKILPAAVAGDRAFADRFQREARALAKLQHPNIVLVHDFGRTEDVFWLVMEFVDGTNIRQAMKAGQVGPKEALAIVPQICDALQYAHEHGVVHRDIKPENVMLDKAGRVKVADFGLAKLMEHGPADASLTGVGQVMGTPHYMAPEQWEKPTTVDHRADIYSLGVVFYEMLTGELPLGRFEPPSARARVDVRLDEVVLRSLEKAPERRYQHVSQVKTDVGRVADGPAPDAVEPPAKTGARAVLRFDSDEEKARGGRLSKLAVAAGLVLPLAVAFPLVAKVLVFLFGGRMEFGTTEMGVLIAVVFAGWLTSLFAWARISHSGDKLRGRVWAAFGSIAPVFGFCVAAPLLTFSGTTPRERALERMRGIKDGVRSATENAARRAVESDGFGEIGTKFKRLVVLGPDAPFEERLRLYDHAQRARLAAMPAPERDAKARRGELGLPMLPADVLPAPLQDCVYDGAEFEDGPVPMKAVATVRCGDATLTFPMSRSLDEPGPDGEMSHWDFAVGAVVIERGSSAESSLSQSEEAQVVELWRSALLRPARPGLHDVIGLYPSERGDELRSMSGAHLEIDGRAGRLGLPLMPADALPDVSQFRIQRIDVDMKRRGYHATLVVSDGRRALKVPLFASGSAPRRTWTFDVAQVEIE